MNFRRLALLLVTLLLPVQLDGQPLDRTLHLAIGDAARKDKDTPVVLDGVTVAATGEIVAPADVAARLRDTQLLLLGESHTSVESHRVQLTMLEALVATGRRVIVGLEMFPYTQQSVLNQWRDGYLTEDGFVALSAWYEHWGVNWRYYRDIFLFAREHHLQMVGVNTPREVVAAVRKKGFADLSPEEAAQLPPDGVDVESAEHMTFFRSSFASGDTVHAGGSDEAWKNMLGAQATWDATMGWHATEAWKQANDPNAIVVVLVGSGHVAYDVGIVRQVRRWFTGKTATLIPVAVSWPMSSPQADQVKASYADYVWGVLPDYLATFPILGISSRLAEDGRRVVVQVAGESAAAAAGFEVNDVLLAMDGQSLVERDVLTALMAAKTWGDAARFLIERDGQQRTLTAYFRRTLPATKSAG